MVDIYLTDLNFFYSQFNFEMIIYLGSPFLCRVTEGDADPYPTSGSQTSAAHSRVSLSLEHLGLVPINVPSQFTIKVAGGDDAELAVSVQGNKVHLRILGSFLV
jgi:hypothetical protein